MRGKVFLVQLVKHHLGITPAYAGKSFVICIGLSFLWDHPRLCGEKAMKGLKYLIVTGSPPPMRGKGEHTFHADNIN